MWKRPLLSVGSPAEDWGPCKRTRQDDEYVGRAPQPNVNLHNGSNDESKNSVESILERNGHLKTSQPIRIDVDMFPAFDQCDRILIKLIQLYHTVAGGMEKTQQAEYLAMLHTEEWRYVGGKQANRWPSAHSAFRTLRNRELLFRPDRMTFNRLAILVASYTDESQVISLRNLLVFKAYHMVGVRYTVCPEVYSCYYRTGLEPWTPPDIEEQALATQREPNFVKEEEYASQEHHGLGNEPRSSRSNSTATERGADNGTVAGTASGTDTAPINSGSQREETPYDHRQADTMAAAITSIVKKEVKRIDQERRKEDEEKHRRITEATKYLEEIRDLDRDRATKVEALAAVLEDLLEQ